MNQLFTKTKLFSQKIVKNGQEQSAVLIKHGKETSQRMVKIISVPFKTRLQNSVQFVDDTLGVSQVSEAQQIVSVQESLFLQAREQVQLAKCALDENQDILNETRKKLDRCDRSDERYLTYVAEEHTLLLEVKKLQRDFNLTEEVERQKFVEYSSAVRLSHEKERSRAERTKYWSIIGSVTGTVFGFMFSSLLTQYRLSQMKDMTSNAIVQATSEIRNDVENQKKLFLEQVWTIQDSALQSDSYDEIYSRTRPPIKETAAIEIRKNLEAVLQKIDILKKTLEEPRTEFKNSQSKLDDLADKNHMLQNLISEHMAVIKEAINALTNDLSTVRENSMEFLPKLNEKLEQLSSSVSLLMNASHSVVRNQYDREMDTLQRNLTDQFYKNKTNSTAEASVERTNVSSIETPSSSVEDMFSAQNLHILLTGMTLALFLFTCFPRPYS